MRRILLLSLVATLCLFGCGGGGSNDDPPVGTISIYNGSVYSVQNIFVTAAGAPSWGDDYLSGYLLPDQTYNQAVTGNSYYDILLQSFEGPWLAIFGAYVPDGGAYNINLLTVVWILPKSTSANNNIGLNSDGTEYFIESSGDIGVTVTY